MNQSNLVKAAVLAIDVPERVTPSAYPSPFKERMQGRRKRQLGNFFNLSNFGVNLTELAPGAESALLHTHSQQDEFVYILSGVATLVTSEFKQTLVPGMCVGFPAGGEAHHLINQSDEPVRFLEIGYRTIGDEATYPQDDLVATMDGGVWSFSHKDGSSY